MTLDMTGHIDSIFTSGQATQIPVGSGSYVNGIWVPVDGAPIVHEKVTVQPVSDREIDAIERGGERVIDMRRIYLNDGVTAVLKPSDKWTLPDVTGTFKTIKIDNRPTRTYAKIIVSLIDE